MKLKDIKDGQRVQFNTDKPYNAVDYLVDSPECWTNITVGTYNGKVADDDGDVLIRYVDGDNCGDWAFVNPECLDLIKEVV